MIYYLLKSKADNLKRRFTDGSLLINLVQEIKYAPVTDMQIYDFSLVFTSISLSLFPSKYSRIN